MVVVGSGWFMLGGICLWWVVLWYVWTATKAVQHQEGKPLPNPSFIGLLNTFSFRRRETDAIALTEMG